MNNKRIEEVINQVKETSDGDFGALYLSGDSGSDTIFTVVKGDINVLATAFEIKMNQSPEFNRLIMSMFGAYLNANPIQKDLFMRGMQLSTNPHGVN